MRIISGFLVIIVITALGFAYNTHREEEEARKEKFRKYYFSDECFDPKTIDCYDVNTYVNFNVCYLEHYVPGKYQPYSHFSKYVSNCTYNLDEAQDSLVSIERYVNSDMVFTYVIDGNTRVSLFYQVANDSYWLSDVTMTNPDGTNIVVSKNPIYCPFSSDENYLRWSRQKTEMCEMITKHNFDGISEHYINESYQQLLKKEKKKS